jgi:hypothetical protein
VLTIASQQRNAKDRGMPFVDLFVFNPAIQVWTIKDIHKTVILPPKMWEFKKDENQAFSLIIVKTCKLAQNFFGEQ